MGERLPETGRRPAPGVSSAALWGGVAAFALGLAAFRQLPCLLPPWLLTLPLLLAVLALYRRPRTALALAAALCAGFWWQGLTAIGQQAHPFPAGWERQTVRVEGRIAGTVSDRGRRRRFRFRARRLRGPHGRWRPYHGLLRLSWYRPVPRRLAYGQRWSLSVRVRRPRGFRNPGGFDYAGYLRARGLSGTGYVRSGPPPERLAAGAGNPARRLVEAGRRRIQAAVAASAGDAAPLLRALTVGKRDRLAPASWELLRVTGTAHLVAISGLHVGWVTLLLFTAAAWMWRRLPRAPLWLPAPRFAALAALAGAAGYAALAGLGLPAQRALIMVAVGLGAWLLGRPFRFERALAAAALAVLAWSPDSLFAPGFWLSFTAVGAIGLLLAGPLRQRGRLAATLAIQGLVVVAVSPWLAFWFGRISLLAPLANAVAIPVVSLAVVPLGLAGSAAALAGMPLLYGPLFAAAGWILQRLTGVLGWLATIPGASWSGPRPDLAAVALMLGGLALLLAGRGRWRWAGPGLALAPLLWLGPPSLPAGQARVWVLDVGQGSAAVVETAGHVAVIDCGPRFSDRFDAGSALVAPFLQRRGWGRVDRLVISHGDADHSGGCPGLRERLPVADVRGAPAAVAADGRILRAGGGWVWDGVRFEVVGPGRGAPRSGNNASRVLRVTAAGGSVLLPGDLEAEGERRLLAAGRPVAADVLVAPHHGSATSSTPALLEAVAPRWAVFSTGYRNRWGFPDPRVAARYRRAGVRLRNTALEGAVRIELGADGVRVSGYRARADRYWNAGARPPPLPSLARLLPEGG
ncbi:MAG TPA: DNA internalization-related competence protein ComEC/Rec2 [Gammaproteobacteria bacterium]|nr:DNA internalization-related competence protein ComEC/Rec2 [Gammaproteobacteria bacterium]